VLVHKPICFPQLKFGLPYSAVITATAVALVFYREPNKKLPDIPVARSSVRPQTALRPQSARPPSARPAAPRIRDRGEIRITEESRWTEISLSMGHVDITWVREPVSFISFCV
jgi:hypothetical protein